MQARNVRIPVIQPAAAVPPCPLGPTLLPQVSAGEVSTAEHCAITTMEDFMRRESAAVIGNSVMQRLHACGGMLRVEAGRRISPRWLDDYT